MITVTCIIVSSCSSQIKLEVLKELETHVTQQLILYKAVQHINPMQDTLVSTLVLVHGMRDVYIDHLVG
jgi:hypothetical protein